MFMNLTRPIRSMENRLLRLAAAVLLAGRLAALGQDGGTVDFNRDVRRILSDNCFTCHGPDEAERKGGQRSEGGLRLDTSEGARADLGGYAAIIPGHPEQSELIARITTEDSDDLMPPADSGKKLTPEEIEVLKLWIGQGAPYARHWSYVKPERAELPQVRDAAWPRNPIDHFILARLEREGLRPMPEADRHALARRVSLDLTGLPPGLDEADAFVGDAEPGAYERFVDRSLEKQAFGEHWARSWLDQARYADSAGYADDPPRTIWGYRDYVIRSLNDNKPFDQFTIEQLAGDLLDDPTEQQLIATAFHRNTLTNNEGGTDDEEYRNVAIVDRVNTTMAVWMGTTMACAQCHDHKYDPISQEDYFRMFAILNNTQDADRRDESPFIEIYTKEQQQRKKDWQTEIARLEKIVATPTPELQTAQRAWEETFPLDVTWTLLSPGFMESEAGAAMTVDDAGIVEVARAGKTDRYTLNIPVTADTSLTGLRLEALPSALLPAQGPGHAAGNFVLSRVLAAATPPDETRYQGRYVRIELPGEKKFLSLAEVQVFEGTENVAARGEARQSSTGFNGPAQLAIDGNTDGGYEKAKSTTHTEQSDDPWWEVDLQSSRAVDRVVVWNRTDGDLGKRLSGFRVILLDKDRREVWTQDDSEPPSPSLEISLSGARGIRFVAAHADYEQKKFEAASVLDNPDPKEKGWAVGGGEGRDHRLTLIAESPVDLAAGSMLTVTLAQESKHEYHTLGRFRLSGTSDPNVGEHARTPASVLAILRTEPENRTEQERERLIRHYLSIAPALQAERDDLAELREKLEAMKPYTTVPVLRELAADKRRQTHVQLRGSFLNRGKEVMAGLPSEFAGVLETPNADRLTLARWLAHEDNPLTARVAANRLWESIFGIGLVRTSEEFGAQGEPPSHPELLDWLAVELIESGWDLKHMLKLMVTSATYRQSSRVTPELLALDPDNRLLARGPRFRLSAEMIRDQAMFVSGLLTRKVYGPPVNPPQPKTGLTAAFGSGIDWETSEGEDRYRRAIYTTWRRSNPYPSMATFDAPNREVCTVRRERSNTPLQALVTLNDPVYVEAAQALARRMARAGDSPADRARHGFRLCLTRPPEQEELNRLLDLFENARSRYVEDREQALALATQPLGDLPDNANVVELAAWTVVANVLLNLDETLMKR